MSLADSGTAPLRVGLAGAGFVSDFHLAAWAQVKGAEVVAICDPNGARAASQASKYGIASAYRDARRMIEDGRLDAFDIASPRETHGDLVKLGRRAGLPILCQKPLAPTLQEAEALVTDQVGTRLMVHENWRFRPPYRLARKWLEAGMLGVVRSVNMTTRSAAMLPGPDSVRPALARQPFLATEGRLVIAELLIHHLDTLRWMFGPLEMLHAWHARTVPEIAGETAATIIMRARRADHLVVLDGTMAAHGYPSSASDRLEVIGDEGSIVLDGARLVLMGAKSREALFDADAVAAESFHATIAHFAACLRSGDAFETDIADNIETMRLVEEAYRLGGR